MGLLQTMLLALGLSADACAVSLANGMAAPSIRKRDAFKTGVFFGGFQFLMTVIGYYLGKMVAGYIEKIDHWIAFILLLFIGAQMILESRKDEQSGGDCMNTSRLFVSAIATSIDALAAGISLAIVNISIMQVALAIGLTTFALSIPGVYLGKRVGSIFKRSASIFGGILLILIGLTILLEHLDILIF